MSMREFSFAEGVRNDPMDHITADPIFVVQEKERLYGFSKEYSSDFEWVGPDGGTADGPGRGHRKVYYKDRWKDVQPFFTKEGAENYIDKNRHNLRSPRVYVKSAYRNAEWQEVRAVCMGLED